MRVYSRRMNTVRRVFRKKMTFDLLGQRLAALSQLNLMIYKKIKADSPVAASMCPPNMFEGIDQDEIGRFRGRESVNSQDCWNTIDKTRLNHNRKNSARSSFHEKVNIKRSLEACAVVGSN
jgi:hypothetical protein